MIQATVAVYPLGQSDSRAIDEAIERLRAAELDVDVRPMQSEIFGDDDAVFAALRDAFTAAAAHGGVVMTVTVSNACAIPTIEAGDR